VRNRVWQCFGAVARQDAQVEVRRAEVIALAQPVVVHHLEPERLLEGAAQIRRFELKYFVPYRVDRLAPHLALPVHLAERLRAHDPKRGQLHVRIRGAIGIHGSKVDRMPE